MENAHTRPPVALPRQRAFVIQFGAGSLQAGRVEHIDSGKCTRFSSVGDLLAFVAGVLRGLDTMTPGDG